MRKLIFTLVMSAIFLFQLDAEEASLYHKSNSSDSIYFGFEGQLVRYIPKGKVEISKTSITFFGGIEVRTASAEDRFMLPLDSVYPLPKRYRNDSLVEQWIGLPLGRKKFGIAEVETIVSGKSAGILKNPNSKGDVIFSFSTRNSPKAGVVKLKNSNVFFLNP